MYPSVEQLDRIRKNVTVMGEPTTKFIELTSEKEGKLIAKYDYMDRDGNPGTSWLLIDPDGTTHYDLD